MRAASGTYTLQIVNRVIWLLFSREKSGGRPIHVLCDGFRKNPSWSTNGRAANNGPAIPGLFSVHPNENVQTLQKPPWTHLLALLGKAGERIMSDLLVNGSIFVPVEAGHGNYYQMSGKGPS